MFYAVLAFMAASGLALFYGDALGLAASVQSSIKEAHELIMRFFVAFVGLHVGGVVVAELRGERGLVSGTIHGGVGPAWAGPSASAR